MKNGSVSSAITNLRVPCCLHTNNEVAFFHTLTARYPILELLIQVLLFFPEVRYNLRPGQLFIFSPGMSDSVTNFGGTLTGGIQDISALLPLIGTEQCEKHVGSALEGGFLYAAATPLSLFGSLGIVKAGISVLVASISIPKPSLSFTPLPKLSFTSSRHLWCGGRVLDNAGFIIDGSVASLIGMDANCYKAESRLIEILDEKHIDTPEKLSIEWRSTEWNVSLVISTLAAAFISGTPYLYPLLKDPPNSIHSPWVFPFLRAVGSSLATVCCQFLIQSRVITLMKSRVIFMSMHRLLVDDLKRQGDQAELLLKDQNQFRWDEALPAEECLWSLEQYLRSKVQVNDLSGGSGSTQRNMASNGAIDLEANNSFNSKHEVEKWITVPTGVQSYISIPFTDPDHILHILIAKHAEHFPTPHLHRTFNIISWLLLLVSLPAAVAGYIGCFTIVANSNSSGPLVWLGLEAMLSVLRILLWAWNPTFDEKTEVQVRLKLTKEQSLLTTQWDVGVLPRQWPLIPERRFLEQITPYTGPLVQFKNPDNTALYFVSTVDKEHTQRRLFMTVLDLTNRAAFTLYYRNISGDTTSSQDLVFANTSVTPDVDSGEMLATIRWDSVVSLAHPRKVNISVYSLAKYYNALLHLLTRSNFTGPVTSLPWRWSLVPRSEEETRSQERAVSTPANLTEHDLLCLQQSHEHHLKTRLMEIFGKWIVNGVEAMYRDGCSDCHFSLADPTNDEAQREQHAFNVLLVREWTKRELAHLYLSAALENVLRAHFNKNTAKLADEERQMLFSLEWSCDLQKQRLEYEGAQAKVRGEDMMKTVGERWPQLASIWQAGQTLLEVKWTKAIESGSFEEGSLEFLAVTTEHEWFGECDDETRAFVEQLKLKFAHWDDQWSSERSEMETTLERISEADVKQLEQVYKYQESSAGLATHIHSKFVDLPSESDSSGERAFIAKVSSATVYDVFKNVEVIRTVAEKSSCRSLIRVDRDLIQHIPENDHLLFCSAKYLGEVNLPFIQRNRNRWWEQQKSNSWTFYLSPQGIDNGGRYVYNWHRTIAHIMIFLQTPTRLRLHLLHSRNGDARLLIQEKGKELRLVHAAEISKHELTLQDYDLDQFEPGQHELELVVNPSNSVSWASSVSYRLRDIVLAFVDSPGSITCITSNNWEFGDDKRELVKMSRLNHNMDCTVAN